MKNGRNFTLDSRTLFFLSSVQISGSNSHGLTVPLEHSRQIAFSLKMTDSEQVKVIQSRIVADSFACGATGIPSTSSCIRDTDFLFSHRFASSADPAAINGLDLPSHIHAGASFSSLVTVASNAFSISWPFDETSAFPGTQTRIDATGRLLSSLQLPHSDQFVLTSVFLSAAGWIQALPMPNPDRPS
jgi:hypothetical protein